MRRPARRLVHRLEIAADHHMPCHQWPTEADSNGNGRNGNGRLSMQTERPEAPAPWLQLSLYWAGSITQRNPTSPSVVYGSAARRAAVRSMVVT